MVRTESPARPPQPQRRDSNNSAKHSDRSHSSSFEADDERSSSEHERMGEDQGFRDSPSQYAGEDTRLTSRQELLGWYIYGFAAEVFVICGIGER
jgi:UMF1 family MFS transporter